MDGKCLSLPLAPGARSIPRFELDAALFQAARQGGVTALEGTALLGARRDQGFHVETAQATFLARALFNATGRWSRLTQFDVTGKQRWLGMKAHFTEPSPPASVDLYFFSDGYCGQRGAPWRAKHNAGSTSRRRAA